MCNPWSERRALLEELGVERSCVRVSDVFDDGAVLFDAVVEHGLEGVVAKKCVGSYRPGNRGSTKIKNRGYWRRESEIAHLQRGAERRGSTASRKTEHVIHNEDGSIGERNSYGSDPSDRPG